MKGEGIDIGGMDGGGMDGGEMKGEGMKGGGIDGGGMKGGGIDGGGRIRTREKNARREIHGRFFFLCPNQTNQIYRQIHIYNNI